jgi:hypothetical protein
VELRAPAVLARSAPSSPIRFARALAVLVAPVVFGSVLFGCPWFKKHEEASGTASSASASASVAKTAPSASALVSEPSVSASALASAAPEIVEDDLLDASPAALASGDATLDGDARLDADAADADGGDAKSKDAGAKAPPGVKKLDDEVPAKGKRKITVTDANVHRAPKDGVTMTTLSKGTEIQLVAQYFDWYRVKFTDPATGKKAQGWVYVTNFIGPRRKSCPESWTYHYDKDGGWCERECTKKADCKGLKDYKCSGGSCYYDGE